MSTDSASQSNQSDSDNTKAKAQRELDRSLFQGVAWVGGVRMLMIVVRVIPTFVLARILSPEDFGVVALAMAYLGFVEIVNEFGLGAAIIQHHHLNEDQIARLGGVCILIGVVLFALSYPLAQLVSQFFGEPAVVGMVMVLAIALPIGGYETVLRSLLNRDLRFKALAVLRAAEGLTSAVVAILLAVLGFGAWSLILGALASKIVLAVGATILRPHRMAWPNRLHTIKDELLFGWHVLAGRVALYVRRFSDTLVVGRIFGTAILGAYNVAWTVANMPVERVMSFIVEVTPSIFAKAQHDNAALRRYLHILTEGVSLVAFPVAVGMALVTDHFVILVLGDRWVDAISPLRVLALAAALRSTIPFLVQVLIAKDQPRLASRFTVITAMLMPIFMLIGSFWGVVGVASAWLIAFPLISAVLLIRPALGYIGMSFIDYVGVYKIPVLGCVATAAGVLTVRAVLPHEWPLALRFSIEVFSGAAIYVAGVLPTCLQRIKGLMSLVRASRAS